MGFVKIERAEKEIGPGQPEAIEAHGRDREGVRDGANIADLLPTLSRGNGRPDEFGH